MTVGDRLREIRVKAGLTQTEFGDIVGLGQRTLSEYERGVNQPGVGRLYLIAEKFGVNSEWLIHGEGEPYKTKEVVDREKIEPAAVL